MRSALRSLVPRRWRRSERLQAWLRRRSGREVLAGPFAGLRYVRSSRGSAYWPKVLGTYELELRAVVERAIAAAPSRVLVAGAAEGYYAVGLATRLPTTEVRAWEPDAEARALVAELAASNGATDRLRLGEICDLPALREALAGTRRALVVVDVDGAESVLLDPRVAPELLEADILVETHDCFVPGVSALLLSRFETSHEVERIEQSPRRAEQVQGLDVPSSWHGALTQLLSERRPPGNSWLWMERKVRG